MLFHLCYVLYVKYLFLLLWYLTEPAGTEWPKRRSVLLTVEPLVQF
jgi:hypothetical protein